MHQSESNRDTLAAFEQFFRTSRTPTFLLDPEGNLCACNDVLYRALGYPDGALRPGNDGILARPPAADLARALENVLAGAKNSVEIDLIFRGPDLADRPFRCRLRGLQDGGRPAALIGELTQVAPAPDGKSARNRTVPEALGIRVECETLRVAAESSNVALWFLDGATRAMWADDYSMLGFDREEVRLCPAWIRNRLHPEDRSEAFEQIAALISGGIDRVRLDCRIRCKDGTWKWFQASGQRGSLGTGGPTSLICGGLVDISDRKSTEDRLAVALAEAKAARSLLEHREVAHLVATESGGIAPWHIDPANGEAWWSDQFYRLLGYEIAGFDYTRDAFIDLIHPDDAPEAIASMTALKQGETEEYHADFRLKCGDGSWRWFDSTARLVNREHVGLGPLICGSMKDIESRKQNEVRLREALNVAREARDSVEAAKAELEKTHWLLEAAIDGGNVCPWYVDPETDESSWSAQFYEIIGHEVGSITPSGQNFIKLVHPEDAAEMRHQWNAMLEGTGDQMKADFRLLRKDGDWVWCHSVARSVPRKAEGLLPLIVGCVINIAERKEIEERLTSALAQAEQARDEAENAWAVAQESQNMLRASATCGEVGPWNVCHETGEGWMMDETYRMMGYEPGDFVPNSQSWRSLSHPDDAEKDVEKMVALMEGRVDTYDMEKRLRHKDGTYHWYRAIAHKIDRSDQGLPYMIAGTTTRIDHLKENEYRLAEALASAKKAGDRLNRLADNAPGALFEFRQDSEGKIDLPYFSIKLADLLGVEKSEMEANASTAFRNIHPEDLEIVYEKIADSREQLSAFEWQYRVRHPKRGQRWLLVSALPKRQPDGAVIWYGNVFDITDRLEIENRAARSAKDLASAHARLTSIADNAPAGIFEFHGNPHGSGEIAYSSARFDDLFGVEAGNGEDLAQAMAERIHPDDRQEYRHTLKTSGETLSHWTHRFRINHPVRGLRWLAGSATPTRLENGLIAWIGSIHDVTKDVEREAELRRAHEVAERMRRKNEWQALHDPLTGLPNRRYFDQKLSDRLTGSASDGASQDCLLVRIDIDRFKYINDTLGHEAGDAVLQRVGEVLCDVIGQSDFAARVGGDEFSILMASGTSEDMVRPIIERIRLAFREPLVLNGRRSTIRASFGIAHIDDLSEIGADIQAFADAALYRAKEKGRDRFEFFTPELHQIIADDRVIAVEIEDAFANDEFIPYFQPQFSACGTQLTGVEALLRWNHPKRGLLAPGSFLHVAQQLRMIPEIDRIVMEKSRSTLERLSEKGIFIPKISFNVSSGRMRDPEVVQAAREIARGETRVAFELLESILVENESDEFNFHLDQVREAGIDIEIDDFGSGHASIIGLMAISPSVLKIDKRIVFPVATDSRSAKLVRAIVEIADTLNIGTVAEGVETREQFEILQEIGCDVLQGYYFAGPLGEDDLAEFVRNWQMSGHRPASRRASE